MKLLSYSLALLPSVTAFVARSSASPSAGLARTLSTATALRAGSSTTEEMIQSTIDSNDVVVFSKSRCPFCMMTKQLFASMDNVEPKVLELDQLPEGGDIQQTLASMTGQRTVPNVFIKGQHIGGNDDTQAAASTGELQKLLAGK